MTAEFHDLVHIGFVRLADMFELGVLRTDGTRVDFRVDLPPAITGLRWESATMELVAEFEPGHVSGNQQRLKLQRSQPMPQFLAELDRFFAHLASADRSPRCGRFY